MKNTSPHVRIRKLVRQVDGWRNIDRIAILRLKNYLISPSFAVHTLTHCTQFGKLAVNLATHAITITLSLSTL